MRNRPEPAPSGFRPEPESLFCTRAHFAGATAAGAGPSCLTVGDLLA